MAPPRGRARIVAYVGEMLPEEATLGRHLGIDNVQPYGERDFLVRERDGVSVLHGETNRRVSLPELDCKQRRAPDRHACFAVIGRPRYAGQVLLLRADGHAELWKVGGSAPEAKTRFAPLREYSEVPAVFRSDGDTVAVTTATGVDLWKPGQGKPYRLANSAELVGPYDSSGRLLLRSDDGYTDMLELWEDAGSSEPLTTLSGSASTWGFDGRFLRGGSELGLLLEYDLTRLADGSVRELCARIGPEVPDVRKSLRAASHPVPLKANTSPPCPGHR